MTDRAQQNVTTMDAEFRSIMKEAYNAFVSVSIALDDARAENLSDKERTTRLAAHISHLCHEVAKLKSEYQAQSLFSQTEQAAFESCKAGTVTCSTATPE